MKSEEIEKRIAKVIREYKKGKGIKQIRRETGIERHTIGIWIGRYKLGKEVKELRRSHIRGEEKEKIKRAIKEGQSIDKISIIYDISRKSIQIIKRGLRYGKEEKSEYRGIRRCSKRVKGRESNIEDSSIDKKNFGWGDIEELRKEYKVKEIVRVLGVSRSVYYYHWKRRYIDKDEGIRRKIREIHAKHKGRYGYRRISIVLKQEGYKINHKKVLRIMEEEGLKNVVRKVRYRSYRGEIGIMAKNLIERRFKAKEPQQKLATDITQVKIKGEKLYLSPIMDMFNGEIVSYKISQRADLDIVKEMLRGIKGKEGTILHSDQGWQYQHYEYRKMLRERGMVASMSRKGNCLDNAKMESFFGTMKKELLYAKEYENIETFKKDLVEYISYYNNERIKIELNGLSPVQYRTKWLEQHTNL